MALICVACGEGFAGDSQRLYCSEHCKWRAKAARRYVPTPRGTRLCWICKDKHAGHSLCARHLAESRVRAPEQVAGICTECGSPWLKDRKTTTTLCLPCIVAARGTFAPNYLSIDKSGYRRARQLGNDAEHIDVLALFDRAGWQCALCTEPVDRSLMWPDPMSASLDHLVPLARGGAHTKDNAQLAHLVCNMRKSDQLAPARTAA